MSALQLYLMSFLSTLRLVAAFYIVIGLPWSLFICESQICRNIIFLSIAITILLICAIPSPDTLKQLFTE